LNFEPISTPSWGILYVSPLVWWLVCVVVLLDFNPLLGNSLCFFLNGFYCAFNLFFKFQPPLGEFSMFPPNKDSKTWKRLSLISTPSWGILYVSSWRKVVNVYTGCKFQPPLGEFSMFREPVFRRVAEV